MAELTPEQKKALALARARLKIQQAQPASSEPDAQQILPVGRELPLPDTQEPAGQPAREFGVFANVAPFVKPITDAARMAGAIVTEQIPQSLAAYTQRQTQQYLENPPIELPEEGKQRLKNLSVGTEQFIDRSEKRMADKTQGIPQSIDNVKTATDFLRYAGGMTGQAAGQILPSLLTGGASSYLQESQAVYRGQVERIAREKGITTIQVIEQGLDDPAAGQGFAVAAAGLDMISNVIPFAKSASGFKNYLRNTLVETITEPTQGVLEEVGAGEDFASTLSKKRIDEAFGGLIGGGALNLATMKPTDVKKVQEQVATIQKETQAARVAEQEIQNTTTGDPALDLQQDVEAQKVIDEITQAKNTQVNQLTNEEGIQERGTVGEEAIPQGIQGQREEGGQEVNLQEEGNLQVNPNTEFVPSNTIFSALDEKLQVVDKDGNTGKLKLDAGGKLTLENNKKVVELGNLDTDLDPASSLESIGLSLTSPRQPKFGGEKTTQQNVNEDLKSQWRVVANAMTKGVKKGVDIMSNQLKKVIEVSKKSGLSVKQITAIQNRVKNYNPFSWRSDERLNAFIDNTIQDAEYADKLSNANGLRKKVKGRIKTAATGNETADVRRFVQIKPENLNSAQLAQYTEIAGALNAKVPDVRPLRAAFDSLVEANELAETGFTRTSTPEQVMASIGNVDDVTDYESFASAKRKLSAARTKFSKMRDDGTIEDDQMELYSNQLDELQSALDETTSKFNEEAEAFKKQRILEAKQVLQSVDPLPNKELQEYVDKFTAITKAQLEKMTPAEVESYFQIAEGLADGFYNKELTDFVAKAKRQANTEKLLAVGDNVKKEVNKRRKFLGLFETSLNPLKDHVKLLKNFMLQHANNWDKILLQGKDRPIYNTLFDPIFAQIDKLTKADNKILSDYYDTSRGVNEKQRIKVGMIMDQLDYQSNRSQDQPVDKMRFLLNQDPAFPNPNAATDAKTKLNESFDIYVEQYGLLPKDTEGNIDVEKALQSLSPKEQKLLAKTQELFKSLRDRAEASTVMMGGEYRDRDNFFFNIVRQKVREGKDADVDMTSAKAVEAMLSNSNNLKTRAGSTFLRTGTPYFVELDVDKVASRYVRDINRNYFLTPVVRENISSIADAAKKSEGEIRTMFDQMYEAAKDRVISSYAFNSRGIDGFNTFLDRLINGQRNLQLARPDRILVEGLSNVGRLMTMYNGVSANATHPGFVKLMEDTNSSVLPNLGNYAEEYNAPDIHGSKTSKKLAELTSDVIAFADAKVRKMAFGTIFNKEFKDKTGQDFSPALYLESQEYRDSVSGVVTELSTKTDALVTDLFNSTNRLNAPSKTRITPWSGLIDTKSTGAKLLGYMQSFATAENATFMHSLRDIAYGTNEGRAAGAKRISALLVSNYIYSTFNYMIYSAIKAMVDDEEELDEALLKPFSPEGFTNSGLATLASLSTGRYGNVLRPVIQAALAIIAEQAKGDPEQEEQAQAITDVMNSALFTGSKAINLRYERPANFVNIIPAVGPLIGDAIGTSLSVIDMSKDFDNMDDREKAYYELGALVNTVVALRMPNPISPTAKKWLDAEIRNMNKKSNGFTPPNTLVQPLQPNFEINTPQFQQPIIPR